MKPSSGQRAVLVTGASTGIGRACALRLDSSGFRVFAGIREEADGASLRADASDRLEPVQLDVTADDQIAAAAEAIEEATGEVGLWGLVNNAGVAVGGPCEVLTVEDWRRQFEINLFGQIAVTKACGPLLRRAKGRIVNMSSMGGRVASPYLAPYTASKHAMEGWTDALRVELAPWKMWACCVQPGAVATPIWDKGDDSVDEMLETFSEGELALYGKTVSDMHDRIAKQRKMGVAPEKVARAVEHALTSRRPRVRYRVGVDTRLVFFMKWLLPKRPFDWVLRKLGGFP